MKVILISGKARSGKDTFANALGDKLIQDGNKVLITHYADLLKYICKKFLGWDGNKDEDGRCLLQMVGTDIIRKTYPSFWVDFIISILTFFNGYWDYVIIPDCRFPNESTKIKDCGFDAVHLRIIREEFDSDLTDKQKAHISETALDEFIPDGYIYNNGTLHELEETTAQWIKENLYAK